MTTNLLEILSYGFIQRDLLAIALAFKLYSAASLLVSLPVVLLASLGILKLRGQNGPAIFFYTTLTFTITYFQYSFKPHCSHPRLHTCTTLSTATS